MTASRGRNGADLLAIVDRVVAQAANGEQLEAFVSRGGDDRGAGLRG